MEINRNNIRNTLITILVLILTVISVRNTTVYAKPDTFCKKIVKITYAKRLHSIKTLLKWKKISGVKGYEVCIKQNGRKARIYKFNKTKTSFRFNIPTQKRAIIKVRGFKKKKRKIMYTKWSKKMIIPAIKKKSIQSPQGDPDGFTIISLLYPGNWMDVTCKMEQLISVTVNNPELASVEGLLYYKQYGRQTGTDDKTGKQYCRRSIQQYPRYRVETKANVEGDVIITAIGLDEEGKSVIERKKIRISKSNADTQAEMNAFADKWIATYIKPEMSEQDKVQVMFNYLNRLKYSMENCDIYSDLLLPEETRVVYGGVCADGATFATYIWHRMGIKAVYRVARLESMNGMMPSHANTFVWVDGVRYIAETQPGVVAGTTFIPWAEEEDVNGGYTEEEYARDLLRLDMAYGVISYEDGPRNEDLVINENKGINSVMYGYENGFTKRDIVVEYNSFLSLRKLTTNCLCFDFVFNTIGACNGRQGGDKCISGNPDVLLPMSGNEAAFFILNSGKTTLDYTTDNGGKIHYDVTVVDGGKHQYEINMRDYQSSYLILGNGQISKQVKYAESSDETVLYPSGDKYFGFYVKKKGNATITYTLETGQELQVLVHAG